MPDEKSKIDGFTICTFLVGIFTVVLQIYQPHTAQEKAASMGWFVVIIIYIGFLYLVFYYTKKIKTFFAKIEKYGADIEKINTKMNEEKRFNEIEKKIAVLEVLSVRRGKKGQIDPRIILFIILLILLYFYLKSIGLIN